MDGTSLPPNPDPGRGPGRREFRSYLVPAGAWLVFCGAALAGAMLGVLSLEKLRSPVDIENALGTLAVAQTLFLALVWPLFESRRPAEAFVPVLAGMAARLVGLLLLSAPLVVLASGPSGVGPGVAFKSQVLVFLFGICAGASVRLPGARLWYYPAVFVLSAAVPLAAYGLCEGAHVATAWASTISPFWAAGGVACGGPAWAALTVFGCLAAVELGVLWAGHRQETRRQTSPNSVTTASMGMS